jgi:ATP/maltotriose-dependent transcriptional regulator MalT/DNA-binding SARP family transcriptional activator
MRRFPPHYVPRPRLTDRCTDSQVVVIEAPAGYGKSVFGAELVDAWGVVGIDVELEPGGVPAPLFVSRLRAAVGRAGFTDAAAAALEAGDDLVGALDAMVATLAGEKCAFIIDDAHEAGSDAGALIARLAGRLEEAHRLVVLARHLPEGAQRLRRAEYLHLDSSDLALTPDETSELCRSGFGLDLDAESVNSLEKSTGGWTAATVLAAARVARTGETAGTLAQASDPAGAVAAILDEAVVTLGSANHAVLAQIARLPLLDPDLVDAVAGQKGFFERARGAGVPFTPGRPPWWDLPGPVRDHMAGFAAPDSAVLRRAAQEYQQRGEPGEALQLLLAAGDWHEAARVLAETPREAIERLDVLELQSVFDRLPDEAVVAYPNVLLIMAGALRLATRFAASEALLERAGQIATERGDQPLQRAVQAELAHDACRRLERQAAEDQARAVLSESAPTERFTRARAYQVLGQVLCWKVDSSGRADQRALDEAEDCFSHAGQIYLDLGLFSLASAQVPYWAIAVDLARGRAADALRRLDQALPWSADRPRRWGYIMCFRIWALAELGQDDLCRAAAEEVFRLADRIGSNLFRAHGHWKLAILASYRGDAEATAHHLRQAELHKDTWWGPGSGDFLAEAADMLDRVDLTTLALEYLERVKAEPKDAIHKVALADAAIEARHGDPAQADEKLDRALNSIEPREYWRITLLRAYAAYRRADDRSAGALAAQAFEEAARLGQADLPLIRERALTEQLLGLAAATGHPAALALETAALPRYLSVLGRFELTEGGRPVRLGPGQEAQLLKLVAVSGGRIHAEQAIDTMWPEVDLDAGRHRLRTVLNRLRATAGDVLSREGDMLALHPEVKVDLHELLKEARRADSLAATDLRLAAGVARGAIVLYRDELLPEDRYADWAEGPRTRARDAVLSLLKLCATDASRRGDLDGLKRVVDRAIELAPYDDTLYLQAASSLLHQGRRGEALSIMHRARSAFAEIGLQPPRPLVDLEESIA